MLISSVSDALNTTREASNLVENVRKQYEFPALGIAQIQAGSSILAVTGVRKYGVEVAAELLDPFHLGSLTKSMTATILASYIAGPDFNLTWNSTLLEALPELASTMNEGHHDTTLTTLTSQYSGIRNAFMNSAASLQSFLDQPSFASRLQIVTEELSRPPFTIPGTTYFYDNLNYMIAGLILELRTNTTYDVILQDRLFAPLNMTSCGLGPLPERSNTSTDSLWPHNRRNEGAKTPVPFEGYSLQYRDNVPALDPAGRVYCPLDSYLKYLDLHIAGSFDTTTLPEPYRDMSPADFTFLHSYYVVNDTYPRGDARDYFYTHGGWLVQPSQPSLLTHDGSNTLNYASIFIDLGTTLANGTAFEHARSGIVATNIGFDLDGGTSVINDVNEVLKQILSRRIDLFASDETNDSNNQSNASTSQAVRKVEAKSFMVAVWIVVTWSLAVA